MKGIKKFLLCGLAFLALLAGACSRPPVNPGEIAVVNGTVITLKQLQAVHDTLVLTGDNPSRAVGALRNEYGAVLADVITQVLVEQQLANKHMEVTREELAAEEALIRADFPQGEFERMLLEESIDFDMWRDMLKKRLSVQKFTNKVLRVGVNITSQEVEDYYLAHTDEFQLSERFHFIQVSGLASDQVIAACSLFRQSPDPAVVKARFTNLTIREVRMLADRLSPEQLAALAKLQPLQASEPMEVNGEYFAMVLLGGEPARPFNRTETYAIIESRLMEAKIQESFDSWLAERMAKSSISLSVHLVPENLK